MSEKYNGWTNYETWNCKLWIDNDHGTYEQFQEMAEDSLRNNDGDKDDTVNDIQNYLENWIDENNPLTDDSSMYSDILTANLSRINHYEIALFIYDEIDDDVKAEYDDDEDEGD